MVPLNSPRKLRNFLSLFKVLIPGLSQDIEKVIQALDVSGSGSLITKLADGLQQFIGYNSSGKITGGGILPANVAKHQVCNAVLNFVIRFLEGLLGIHGIGDPHKPKVQDVIVTLRKCVGTGTVPEGFSQLVEGIKGQVETNSGFNDGVGPSLRNMLEELKDIVTTASFENTSSESVDALNQFLVQAFNGRGNNEQSGDFQKLCQNIANLFGDSSITNGSLSTDKHLELNSLKNAIGQVPTQANKLNPSKFKTDLTKALAVGVQSAATAFIAELQTKSYTSFYNGADNKDVGNDQCAKIFIACLPLYYQALTYIYWGSHGNGGGWRNLTLGGGALRSYFDSQGFLSPYVDRNKTDAHIAETALGGFSEFTQGMRVAASSPFPYATFTNALKQEVTANIGTPQALPSTCPLSALFYGASCYFQCLQIKNAKSAVGAPKTIREMLYFLAALQFSSAYYELNEHIGTLLTNQLDVADSSETKDKNILSADQLKEYLRASCAFSPSVLGVIQGPGASDKSEPWLFELFCNSAFQFKYPTGASLFSLISNYAYALQFKLLFLYQQCSNNGVKCGWQECTYGKEIKGSGGTVPSHICPGLKCDDPSKCQHDGSGSSNGCNHNKYTDGQSCGKGSNGSPLQAFLTDGIQGMCRQHPGSSDHLATCSGPMCHTPMGFEGTHLRQDPGTGNYILSALRPICGDVSSPFRQLCEKLGCLTKRTPRTLGDLFGFTWHLNGQLFNTELLKSALQTSLSSPSTQSIKALLTDSLRPSTDSLLSKTLNTLESGFTFWGTLDGYFSASALAVGLYGLNQHCHKKENDDKITHNTGGCNTSPNDLWSVLQPVRNTGGSNSDCSSKNCGGYLSPLTHSAGATYAPVHASVYLSWMVYLTDDFHEWFQNLLVEFKNIDCSKTGCRGKAGGKEACTFHAPGTHGTSDNACTCDSVVHCGGELQVLYRHGFQFYSPYSLSGEIGGVKTKRNCKAFADQLQSVLAEGAPLTNLLTTIDDLLYLFRFYFLYNQSGFWTIYVCIILYTFFFLLDTLRVRSHLHFPSSHSISTISLLGTRKAPALKKFTKLTYFIS
ncbi:variant erythrocyte surface antigen-1 family protein [Babesia caballi]|uniref:Variant erythrocyte surface antigen-1 family protein n=1 Tax=Babesia caballi TaxID=5871 RepID=A0AAV4LRP3_BABCB|nr:variant erythrocyte surface antigen-1 family protein [Babesia caballi]